MPRRRLHACLLCAILALSMTCASIDNLLIEESSQTTIPERGLVEEILGEFAFVGFDGFDIEQSEEFAGSGYSKDQIDSVRLVSLTLEITSPSGGSFDFLESIAFYAEAEGLSRVRIASLDPVPQGVSSIELEIDDAELVDYAVAPSMSITTEATGLRPEQETTVQASVLLDVDVNVDGSLGCN